MMEPAQAPTESTWDMGLKLEAELTMLNTITLLKKFKTTMTGLTMDEVKKRHSQYGYNEPPKAKETHPIFQILRRFTEPLMAILLVVATVSLVMGQIMSATLVYGMAIVSVLLSFFQEYRAHLEAQKLSGLVSTTATAIRNGRPHEINIRYLVPGDIVDLSAGDIVPADIRILSEKDLYINQAALTGESFPVEKTAEPLAAYASSITAMTNIAFMGSNVVSGTAVGLVVKTGTATQFGGLAAKVSGQAARTSFDIGVNKFVILMIWFMAVLVLTIFAINALLKGNPIEALLFSLAVAVGLTPEMLPMLITVNLSKSAHAMAKKNVIVKKLSAIQNFGAMDILCTDKTGTLTLGEVILEKHFDLDGRESEAVLMDAYLNSYFQTGLKNLLDKAILKHEHLSARIVNSHRKIDEVPFDFSRKMMSVVVENNGRHLLISKGAPEEVIKRCTKYERDGAVEVLAEAHHKLFLGAADKHRNDGFRVLALAYREFAPGKKTYSRDDECELVLKGFMIFLDPPKPTVKRVIESLQKLGILFKVLTGDNELVTRNVCNEVGLDLSAGGIATGDMLEGIGDKKLSELVEKTSVFARLTPLQKERIIHALRKNDHIVGYLGDGINDAPALRASDVGISVNNAADIAKETADLILLKKSLTALCDGVVEGRKTYANILKYVKMGASSNFGNMFSITGASLFLQFLPMLPIQILLNNFLYDMSQMGIPTDNVDSEYISKPTPWNIEYIKKVMIFFGPISSLFDFITYGVLLLFSASQPLFHTVWFLESLCTQTLVVHVIRTAKLPFLESRPSNYLIITSVAILVAGVSITLFQPLGSLFGFVAPPPEYFLIIAGIVGAYLILVQVMKSWFVKKYGWA